MARPPRGVAVQTDAVPPRSVTTAAVQVDTSKPPPRSTTTAAVQVDMPKPTPTPTQPIPQTADTIIQTNSIEPEHRCPLPETDPHPDPSIIPSTSQPLSATSHSDPNTPVSPSSISVSAFLSSLFDPLESAADINLDSFIPSPNIQLPSTSPTSFLWSEEPSDIPIPIPLPPTPPLVPIPPTSFPRRDLSNLRSGANPWCSLQHRKGRDRRRSTQPVIRRHRQRQQPFYSSNYYPRNQLPAMSSLNSSYPPPPIPPALDWDRDPRLFELSRVLQSLGFFVMQRGRCIL